MENIFVVKYKLTITIALVLSVVAIGSFAEQMTVQKVDVEDKIEIVDKAEIVKQSNNIAPYSD